MSLPNTNTLYWKEWYWFNQAKFNIYISPSFGKYCSYANRTDRQYEIYFEKSGGSGA